MKKTLMFAVLLVYLLLMAKDATIAVKEAYLQSEPDFLAERVAVLPKGAVVNLQSEKSGWYYVKYKNSSGYLHSSVFGSQGKSLFALKTDQQQPSDKEVALAAKGFSEENESKIKGSAGYNFYDLEWVVVNRVLQPELKEFVKEGGLK